MKHEIKHQADIDGISYVNLTEAHIKDVIDFYFDVFLQDEPTTVAAGGYHYRHPNIIKQVEEIIDDGVSVIALDQDNQLVGIMLSHTVTRDGVEPRSTFTDNCKVFPTLHASVMTLFDEIMFPGDIFQNHPEDTKYYDMFTLATKPGLRGKGIGKKLVQQSLILAQKAKCSAAIVLATSDFSRKIFVKLDFELISSKEWEDCLFDGNPAFGDVPAQNATAHYLKLSEVTA